MQRMKETNTPVVGVGGRFQPPVPGTSGVRIPPRTGRIDLSGGGRRRYRMVPNVADRSIFGRVPADRMGVQRGTNFEWHMPNSYWRFQRQLERLNRTLQRQTVGGANRVAEWAYRMMEEGLGYDRRARDRGDWDPYGRQSENIEDLRNWGRFGYFLDRQFQNSLGQPRTMKVPSGMTHCSLPSCGAPTDTWYIASGASCGVFGSCPSGQATGVYGVSRFWSGYTGTGIDYPYGGNQHAQAVAALGTQGNRLFLVQWTAGSFFDGTYRGTWRAQFATPAGSKFNALPSWSGPTIPVVQRNRPVAAAALRSGKAYNLAPNPRAKYDVDTRLAAKPTARRSIDLTFGSKGPPKVTVGKHASKPDGAKKRKGLPVGMLAALKAMHTLSEFADAGEALYDALPPIARCAGQRGIVHDWLCVLSHWDAYFDPATFQRAVTNLVVNHVTDEVIGRLMGSNWRAGVRSFNDQYGTAGSIGGGYGAPELSINADGLWSVQQVRMSPF